MHIGKTAPTSIGKTITHFGFRYRAPAQHHCGLCGRGTWSSRGRLYVFPCPLSLVETDAELADRAEPPMLSPVTLETVLAQAADAALIVNESGIRDVILKPSELPALAKAIDGHPDIYAKAFV